MGMRNYAVNDYGLLMTDDMLKIVASKVCENYSDEDFDDDPWAFNDELCYKTGLVDYISEFTGESMEINDDGSTEWSSGETYNYDRCYYVSISNYPSLFKRAYENIDEMVAEFREKIGEYLPDDFDYREHIRHIVGTYYG